MSYYQRSFETGIDRESRPVSIIRVDPTEPVAPRKALEALRAGGLVVLPTEAGYVVGCLANDAAAVARLRQVTGAPADGLTTLTANRHPVVRALAQGAGAPLAVAPCRPGARPAPTAQQVVFQLGDQVDLVLDAGAIGRQPVPAGGAR